MKQEHINQVIEQLEHGMKFKKCWSCACFQGTVTAIESQLMKLNAGDQKILFPVLDESKKCFIPKEYDCLGCKVCYPSIATNELMEAYPDIMLPTDGCSDDNDMKERAAWPPLPGRYEIFRYEAPVAICTLNSKKLLSEIYRTGHAGISLVGSLNTENLGIERIIKNVVTNPNIRYLILCGSDSEQKIGHLPGQSFLALHKQGIDENKRIIGAQGRRPVLKNVDINSVTQFKSQVEVVNMIGCNVTSQVIQMVDFCVKNNPGIYENGVTEVLVKKIQAKPPCPLILDPKGYFIIFPERAKNIITVEHYHNNGTLNQIIEGREIDNIYMTIIELDLISKLDHACYLGKELARAEESLLTGKIYQQDKAQDENNMSSKNNASCGSDGCC